MILERLSSIRDVDKSWDNYAQSIYQTTSFLEYLEQYNPCKQRYYQLSKDGEFLAGTSVYTLEVDLLTFSEKIEFKLPMCIIGIAVSVDSNPLIGDEKYFPELIRELIKNEKGLILCLNYLDELKDDNLAEMITLPNLVLKNSFSTWENYLASLRHPYRRKFIRAEKKFEAVNRVESTCEDFTAEHYKYYLDVMDRSTTKLETLNYDFFVNLPAAFVLDSFYNSDKELLSWNIRTKYKDSLCFMFIGLNYNLLNKYNSYYNNLFAILKEGISSNCTYFSLGQTAEYSKKTIGGKYHTRRMFLHHKNYLINSLLKLIRAFISYKVDEKDFNVFKKVSYENSIYPSETSTRHNRLATYNDS